MKLNTILIIALVMMAALGCSQPWIDGEGDLSEPSPTAGPCLVDVIVLTFEVIASEDTPADVSSFTFKASTNGNEHDIIVGKVARLYNGSTLIGTGTYGENCTVYIHDINLTVPAGMRTGLQLRMDVCGAEPNDMLQVCVDQASGWDIAIYPVCGETIVL